MAELPVVRDITSYPEQTTRDSRLEGYRYTSKEFFEQEWEGMWTRVWLLLGPGVRTTQSRRLADGASGRGRDSHGSTE